VPNRASYISTDRKFTAVLYICIDVTANSLNQYKLLKDACGQEFNKQIRRITISITQLKEQLRSARAHAKRARIVDAYFFDCIPDFSSTLIDRIAEHNKSLIGLCNRKRITKWQKAH
jgi:hypothetical protein